MWESIMSNSNVLQSNFFGREINSCFCKNENFPEMLTMTSYKGWGLIDADLLIVVQAGLYWYELPI